MTISFNDQEIKKMSKAEFLKMHKAFARVVDLEAYYDKVNPKKKVVKRKSK
tara:strand:+ start:688 stop:840 length:153 start_codon:yes stop_codon:yes gene_type:complete